MLVSEFIEQLKNFEGNKSIAVEIEYPSGIAYSPNSPIIGLYQGFDWDSNMVFIETKHHLETTPNFRKRLYDSEIKRNIEDVKTNRENIRVRQLSDKKASVIKDLKSRDVTNLSLSQLKEIEDILSQTR